MILIRWFALVALALLPALAGETASESELKAAMLFNFGRFIEWTGPKGDQKTPLVIGVMADTAVFESLEDLARKSTTGRAVRVRRVERALDCGECHLLFAGRRAPKRPLELLAAARKGTVTVGDADGFAASGVIGFVVEDNRLRFEVNLSLLPAREVSLSSKLLGLARSVRQ